MELNYREKIGPGGLFLNDICRFQSAEEYIKGVIAVLQHSEPEHEKPIFIPQYLSIGLGGETFLIAHRGEVLPVSASVLEKISLLPCENKLMANAGIVADDFTMELIIFLNSENASFEVPDEETTDFENENLPTMEELGYTRKSTLIEADHYIKVLEKTSEKEVTEDIIIGPGVRRRIRIIEWEIENDKAKKSKSITYQDVPLSGDLEKAIKGMKD